MKPAKRNLTVYKGATFRHKLTWSTRANDEAPIVLVDLTGASARMQVRSAVTSPDVLIELTTENGGIVLGGAAGTVEVVITDAQSTAWAWSSGVYDLEIVLANGDVRRLLEGSVTVKPEVTRV